MFAESPSSGAPLFNARSETALEKPAFRDAVLSRRAVIPATGYYEWLDIDGVKTPQFVSLPGGELMLFAGLYEWWRSQPGANGAPGPWLLSATILTRAAAGALSHLHERMPVFLDGDLVEEWLDPHSEGTEELLEEVAHGAASVADRASFYRVAPAVGTVANNGAELLLAAD